jgi:hypothetical protein
VSQSFGFLREAEVFLCYVFLGKILISLAVGNGRGSASSRGVEGILEIISGRF